jgi:hypothetical protein
MKHIGTVGLALLIIGICVATAQNRGNQSLSLTIEKPSQNESVGVRHEISGTVSTRSARVWVIIQPREIGDCWVQTPIIVNSDQSWRLLAQFGEDTPEHWKKSYEVRALANPKGDLRPGKTSCWPEAEAYSDPLYVIRK